jgi:hypothetical protein
MERARIVRVVRTALAAYGVAAGLLAAVLGGTGRPYGFFDVSDVHLYRSYAAAMARGDRPYADFAVEYPPLALQLFRLPGAVDDLARYQVRFAVTMILLGAVAAVLVALAAARLFPEGRRAHAAGLAFGGATLAAGAIVANRYDLGVALLLAAALLLATERRWALAGAALGLGFALKLVPAVLLPLLLLLPGRRRSAVLAALAFAAAAAAPFLPYLGAGVSRVFGYHLGRPLQLETVLATPLLAAHALGLATASVGSSHGSHFLAGPGTVRLAAASGPLALAALGVVYALAWRARATLRARPAAVPVAALAVLLAIVVTGKVLSPQFLVWLLPAIALAAPERPAVAALAGTALVLTQVEFPAMYWALVRLEPAPIWVVVARNLVLAGAFAAALGALARLPARPAGVAPSEAAPAPAG